MTSSHATELERIARQWMRRGWQEGDPAVVDELHAPGFIDHSAAGRDPGADGFKQGIVELYAAFSDFHATTDDLVVDPEAGKVAIRWTASGTHSGPFMGLPPTGLRLRFAGIEIIRIANGRIAERWGEWNGLELLDQLGREA